MGIMGRFYDEDIKKSPRIDRLISHLYAKMPVIEADRAVLLTESYRETDRREQQHRPARLPGLPRVLVGMA